MYLPIIYALANARHPEQVAEVMANLRRGKSKNRLAEPMALQWGYDWSVEIGSPMVPGRDLVDMMLGRKNPPKPKEFKTEDEAVADYAQRVNIMLSATIGKKTWYSDTPVPPLPKEIEDQFRENFRRDAAEKARLEALSPEEREAELLAVLRPLSRSPGFMALQIPRMLRR